MSKKGMFQIRLSSVKLAVRGVGTLENRKNQQILLFNVILSLFPFHMSVETKGESLIFANSSLILKTVLL